MPKSITIKLWDKFRVRQMMENQPLLFHLMLKQGFNCFTLTQENQEVNEIWIKLKQNYMYIYFRNIAREISPFCNFIFGSIWTGLLTDKVDVELVIRTIKGIYMYRKDHMAESTCFCHGVGPLSLFPHCIKSVSGWE